jgi:hypothetical protein
MVCVCVCVFRWSDFGLSSMVADRSNVVLVLGQELSKTFKYLDPFQDLPMYREVVT